MTRVVIVGEMFYSDLSAGHPIAPGGPPPIASTGPGFPTHPIAPGGQPPGIWGGGGVGNYPDAGFPGPQPGGPVGIWPSPGYPDQGLPGPQPHPSHPIAPGGRPPGIWGGGGVGNYPDAGFPGPQPGWGARPTPPIYYPPTAGQGPGFPTNPIVLPIPPGEQPPEPGNGHSPSHPIVIPPAGDQGSGEHALVYTHIVGVGGVWFLIEKPGTPPSGVAEPKE